MIQEHNFEKITSIRIVDDIPVTPEKEVRVRAFSLGNKLLKQHKKATEYAKQLKASHGAGSAEYIAMNKHKVILGKKGVAFSNMSWGQGATEEMIAELYPIQRPDIFSIQVNGEERQLPATLQAMTFEQVIGFALQYGNDLEVQLNEIKAMKPGPDQQTALILWQVDKQYKAVSYFAGVPLEALKISGFDSEIAGIYQQTLQNVINPQ